MAPAPITKRHIPELDGLRGIAALAVVFHHLAQIYLPFVPGRLLHIVLDVFALGYLGVDVFFALSGFLITSILLEKRGTPHYYRNFYVRRLLRLAPAYLLTLGLVALLVPHSGPYLLLSLVYLANMASLFHVTMTYGLLWTLSVEEHFYLVWPWLVRFVRLRGLAIVCALLCVVTPVARIVALQHGAFNYMFSWYRFDGLAWGALLALLLHSRYADSSARRFSRAAALGGLAVCLAGFGAMHWRQRELASCIFYSGAAMISTGIVGFAVIRPGISALGLLRVRLLRRVGDVSYWVYLTHYLALSGSVLLLQHFAGASLAHAGWGMVLLAALITLAPTLVLGVMVRRWIELPVLRLKSKFR